MSADKDAGLHAFVARGPKTGTLLYPHKPRDGSYVVSMTRFEKDYIKVANSADLLDWLAAESPVLPLVLGDHSFGSLVGLSVGADDERVVALLGLGLPVDMDRYDYSFLAKADKPVLVVQGENDEFGPGESVSNLLALLGAHITVVRIPGSDHYFTDRLDELRATVRGYYESGPGSRFLTIV